MADKIMTGNELALFIIRCHRAESGEPLFGKGVRVALASLGYNMEWLESEFRAAYETYHSNDL